jgi:predicted ribosomally synthesized peptide with SipW-like signal peptide
VRGLRWPGALLALVAAVVLAGGSLAVFTDRETNPQTLSAATSWGTPTPTPTATPTPTPTPTPAPEATLKARYKNGTPTQTMDETIYPWLQVVNTGRTPADLKRVKARYWFTRDAPDRTVFVAECDYAQLGCGNVTRTVAAWSPARPGADTYLELGFTAGTLAPGETTGETQLRIHEQGYQVKLDETNDYSWGSNGDYRDWTKVALYYSGTRVWGTEP